MVTYEQFEQGRLRRVVQQLGALGDAIGKLWLGIISAVVGAGIIGAIAFAWSSNGDIHDLKSGLMQMQQDIRDLKDDVRDMRRNGVKPAQP